MPSHTNHAKELFSDAVVYGIVKQILHMAKVPKTSATSVHDVVSFTVADAIYVFGVREGNLFAMGPAVRPASGMDETQKALTIMLIMWLWNLLVKKDRGGLTEIALTVGASSIVSNWIVDDLLFPGFSGN